jgi:chemotaxis protein MotA
MGSRNAPESIARHAISRRGRDIDLTTLVGLIAEFAVLANGAGGQLGNLIHWTPLLFVLLGGLAATLVVFPFRSILNLLNLKTKALVAGLPTLAPTVEMMVGMSEIARRAGILALETAARESKDGFAITGIRLAVDGTEPELIQAILETELEGIEHRHEFAHELLRTLGNNFAIFGVIGALILLALNPAESALGIVSQAAHPLLYGLVLALLFSLGFRKKLILASQHECLQKRMVMEGVMCIQSGDNPRIIEQKLNLFLPPKQRTHTAPARKPKAEFPPRTQEFSVDTELVERVGSVMSKLKESIATYNSNPRELNLEGLMADLPPDAQKTVLETLGERTPEPEIPVSSWTFSFEDVAKLTDREIQMILREIDGKDLTTALLGTSAELRDRFLENVSQRVATLISEEMTFRGPVLPRDVVAVQLRIVRVILQLQEAGQVSITRTKPVILTKPCRGGPSSLVRRRL